MFNGKQQNRLDGRNPFSWWNVTTLTTWILDIAQLEKCPGEAREEGAGGETPAQIVWPYITWAFEYCLFLAFQTVEGGAVI